MVRDAFDLGSRLRQHWRDERIGCGNASAMAVSIPSKVEEECVIGFGVCIYIFGVLVLGFAAGYLFCWIQWWHSLRRLPQDFSPNFVDIEKITFNTKGGYAFHELSCNSIRHSDVCILHRVTALNAGRSSCKKCNC
jgi:hypothetical protein